jgi:hypothetical protein
MLGANYLALICILIGHQDEEIKLNLGKTRREEIRAEKCRRCGRVLILKSELEN